MPFICALHQEETDSENTLHKFSCIKNAPTCYRAPRWPDLELPRKNRKHTPRAEILERKNTEKIPNFLLGVQNFGPGAFFSLFFMELPGRAIPGLCSRSGRSQFMQLNKLVFLLPESFVAF